MSSIIDYIDKVLFVIHTSVRVDGVDLSRVRVMGLEGELV